LLRAQNLANQVYVGFAPKKAPKPAIVVRRTGGDRNATLSGDDGSLVNTNVEHQVLGAKASDAVLVADALVAYLNGCWPVACGTRTIVGVVCDEVEDLADPPQDDSDNWVTGTQFTALVQTTG
jgi:hypothetical protein